HLPEMPHDQLKNFRAHLDLMAPNINTIYNPGHEYWADSQDVRNACILGDRVFLAVNITSEIEFSRTRLLLEFLEQECHDKIRLFIWKNLLENFTLRPGRASNVSAPVHWILTPAQWQENVRTLRREVCR